MSALDGGRVNIASCSLGGASFAFDVAKDYLHGIYNKLLLFIQIENNLDKNQHNFKDYNLNQLIWQLIQQHLD